MENHASGSCLKHNQGSTPASQIDATSASTGIGALGFLYVVFSY